MAESNEIVTVSITDMVAVKLWPTFKASALYYNMKLNIYNFTLHN